MPGTPREPPVDRPRDGADDPSPPPVDGPDARLGSRAIAATLRRELLGLDHGLVGQLLRLIRCPGAVGRQICDAAHDPLGRALRLFLVANLLFFIVGPSVGLMDYTVDSLAGVPGYAERIRGQIERLGTDVEAYRVRFNTAFDFRQPTFVIVIVPILALASAAARRRGPAGRHLVVGLLGLAWVLLVWPLIRIGGVAVEALGAPLAVAGPLTVILLALSALWALARLGRGVLGLGRLAALGYGFVLTLALVLGVAVHGQLTFWVTFGMFEVGA
jgi:hypothetical protein